MSEEKITLQDVIAQAGNKLKKHEDRQDYLAALARYVEAALTDAEFDRLIDDHAEWYSEAADAINSNIEIPDFEDSNGEEGETADADDYETGAGSADEGDLEPDSEPTGKPAKSSRSDSDNKPKKARKEKAAKAGDQTPKPDKKRPDYASLTGEKDRYGVIVGTKTHSAVVMYEKGCTAKQIEDELGGRHYNILKKLEKEGHHVDKLNGGVWKLIHKDDYGKKAKGK